jgi:hypothetical protein
MNDKEKEENDIINDEDSLNEFFDTCEQCGEEAWDGYICHNCGIKKI